ncbi:MAG: sulfotransferase [Bacteroidia bacterium]
MKMQANMKAVVVILLSDKRSGSTLFQEELCKHSLVQTVRYSSHTYLETHHWLKAAVLTNQDASKYSQNRVYDGYGSINNARGYLIDTVVGNVKGFEISQNDQELIYEGWEALCQEFAKPVFFEKSPQVLAEWAAIEALLDWKNKTNYSVKLIGLTRNPMSVLYSAYELFNTSPEERQFGWKKIQENLLRIRDMLTEDELHLVSYEDLINRPAHTFKEITDFIGIPYESQVGEEVHGQSLTKWRDDPNFDMKLDQKVAEFASQFGYQEQDLFNPNKPLAKRRKSKNSSFDLFLTRLRDRFYKPLMLRFERRKKSH